MPADLTYFPNASLKIYIFLIMGHGFEMRKKTILDKLDAEGSILVKELADELQISETTIRRDLNELNAAGLLKQVYGGAVRIEQEPSRINFSISNRSTHNIEAKKIIGKCAASLVHDNDILYIDPGTTSWEMIPYLKEKQNLTIISNSVRLLQCLEYIGHHNIIQLGGTLRPDRLDTVGTVAQMGIEQLRGYKAFQGGDGLDIGFGLSAVDHESAMIAKAILSAARETIILADHSKFEQPDLLYKIIDIDKIDILITDDRPPASWEDKCRESSVQLIITRN
ncbi:MAG: DeoR family transcriptional regulator [Chitinivibrionales bacterium]|nr:DeoR family transcriptional regulator [Chitinivibrionales bacterium]